MQISRHWRMQRTRYRLQGVRYPNGDVSLQYRPQVEDPKAHKKPEEKVVPLALAIAS